jgi:hypothetical protein
MQARFVPQKNTNARAPRERPPDEAISKWKIRIRAARNRRLEGNR